MPLFRPPIEIRDEGVIKGTVSAVDFVGAGVSSAVSGSLATVTISGGAGGGATITEVETNIGTTAKWRGTFTITDAGISGTSKVYCWQAPGPYTGKGTRSDEAEMDWILCHVVPGSGSATVHWRAVQSFSGYQGVNNSSYNAVVIGKVRGNVKFHYLIGA